MRTSIRSILTALGIAAIAVPAVAPAAEARSVKARPNYSVQFLGDSQTVPAGGSVSYPFIVRRTGGFSSAVSFRVLNLPAGAAANVVRQSGNVYALQVFTAPNMPSSSTVSVLQGRSGASYREALFRLTVNGAPTPPVTQPPVTQPPVTQPPVTQPPVTQPPVTQPPNFTVRADTPQATARTNETAQFGFTVDRSSGYTGPVEFRASGLPAGTTANFAPNPTNQGTVLYVTPGPTAPTGSYPVAITATAGPTVRFASVVLNVQAQIDFGLSALPSGVGIPAGQTATFTVDLTPVGGAPVPSVNLEVVGLPANTTARLSANPTNRRATLTVTTRSNTPAGTYNLVITGRSGPFVHSQTVQLFVTALPVSGFGLSANPSGLNLARGTTSATTVTVTPTGGFSGAVTFNVSNLPTGLAWVANPAPGGAVVQFLAGPNAQPGQYNVTVTGTSGSLSAAVTLLINVI